MIPTVECVIHNFSSSHYEVQRDVYASDGGHHYAGKQKQPKRTKGGSYISIFMLETPHIQGHIVEI